MSEDDAAPGRRGELLPCDLVMKGGITSGVVYPAAIKRLSEKYVFRNVGGASAGAIAAVIAAACEYRRREEPGVDAFVALDAVNDEIKTPRFIQDLFQPTKGARPAFEAALALQAGKPLRALRVVVQRSPAAVAIVLAAVLLWIAFVAVTVVALATDGVSTIEIVALVLLALVSGLALAVLLGAALAMALARIAGDLNAALVANGLGMCTGKELTEWLHRITQFCAGPKATGPLTFGMLRGEDKGSAIVLQLVTTDLSYSRPVDLPLPDSDEGTVYYFRAEELGPLLPDAVVKAMTHNATPVRLVEGGDVYYRLPGSDMPIVVAARLSLSFPILLATVPLWSAPDGAQAPVRHTMSDGGISSNFPIHFFDMLLPRWPTFGLDLQPYPDPADAGTKASNVVFGPEQRAPVFTAVSSVFSFARQILNAALDWRDTMQAELPGFRDRVCQIHLSEREGGLNLDMPADVVEALEKRGLEAAETIVRDFEWDCHRFMRYLTFMQVMQDGLQPAKDAFASFPEPAGEMPPRCPRYDFGKPPAWRDARPLTALFLDGVRWGEGHNVDFADQAPTPKGWARVTPRV